MSEQVRGPSARSTAAQRLFVAALDLFERHGYENVTTTQVAEAAGVTQRTLFRHYPTKVELLSRPMEQANDEFHALLSAQPLGIPVVQALAKAIAEHAKIYEPTHQSVALSKVVRDSPELQAYLAAYLLGFERTLAEWIAARVGRSADDLQVAAAAAMLVGARRVVVDRWMSGPHSEEHMLALVDEALGAVDLLTATRNDPV